MTKFKKIEYYGWGENVFEIKLIHYTGALRLFYRSIKYLLHYLFWLCIMKYGRMIIWGLFVLLMVCIIPVSAMKGSAEGYNYDVSAGFPNQNGQTGHNTYGFYKWEGSWDSAFSYIDVPTYLEITAVSSTCSVASNIVTCNDYNVPNVEFFIDTKVKTDTPIGTCSPPIDADIWFHPLPPSQTDIIFHLNPRCVISQPPVANAGPDRTVTVNELVTFDGSGSYDPDGTIVSYLWIFRGSPPPEAYPMTTTHTFPTVRTYEVILEVNDNTGQNGQDEVLITVIEPGTTVPEFPSAFLPAAMIIGFLGAVLLIQTTREH